MTPREEQPDDFFVLPGESLAKYTRPGYEEENEDPRGEAAVEEPGFEEEETEELPRGSGVTAGAPASGRGRRKRLPHLGECETCWGGYLGACRIGFGGAGASACEPVAFFHVPRFAGAEVAVETISGRSPRNHRQSLNRNPGAVALEEASTRFGGARCRMGSPAEQDSRRYWRKA